MNSISFLGVNAAAWMNLGGQSWELSELDGYETPIKDGQLHDVVSGDLNQDGAVDGSDQSSLHSVLSSFIIGQYDVHDLTGDGFVDQKDLRLIRNNVPLNNTVQRPH